MADMTPPTTQTASVDTSEAEELNYDEALDEDIPEEDEGPLLTWQTSEPPQASRPHSWYIIMGLIAAGIIIAAILTKTWIFIPLGILVPIALTMYGSKGPGSHSYVLESFGVKVDAKSFPYDDFKAFFVIEDKGQAVFELIPLQRLGQLVTLHAGPEQADDVSDILSSVLPETEPQGYLGESVFKRLKF